MFVKLLLILLPLLVSNILTFIIFPADFKNMKTVYFQPPSYVFGIVWTVIYFMSGVYLYRLSNTTEPNLHMFILLGINLCINFSWTPVVNTYRMFNAGIYLIGLMLLSGFALIVLENDKTNKLLMVPYMVWLVFALLLNIELSRIYNGHLDHHN